MTIEVHLKFVNSNKLLIIKYYIKNLVWEYKEKEKNNAQLQNIKTNEINTHTH